MKKIMLLVALMVATVSAKAQQEVGTVALKPMVGMTIANVTDQISNNAKAGLIAGVEAEYRATPLIGVTAGLLYSMQGTSFDDYIEGGVGVKDAKYNMDYINIPILANFYVYKGLALKVGIQPAFNVSAKSKYTLTNGSDELEMKADMDEVKSFDFSIPVGVSYEFSDFVVDARYNWGLTKIADDTDCKNSVFQITLGYKFGI